MRTRGGSYTALHLAHGRPEACVPDVFAVEESQHTEFPHVPRGAVVVVHQVEGEGHMGVAVVTAEVMLQETQGQESYLLTTIPLLLICHSPLSFYFMW